MRKIEKKLSLRRETVRTLASRELGTAAGGLPTVTTQSLSLTLTVTACGGGGSGGPDTRYMNGCDETNYAPCL